MRMIPLGRTGLEVSELCLGTMTWGSQNTEAEGHAQIDMSLDHGINFIDTAEMYPTTPLAAETGGPSPRRIHRDLAGPHRPPRRRFVLATKHKVRDSASSSAGPSAAKHRAYRVRGHLRGFESEHQIESLPVSLIQPHGQLPFPRAWNYDPSGQQKAETLAITGRSARSWSVLRDSRQDPPFRRCPTIPAGAPRRASAVAEEKPGWPRVESMAHEYIASLPALRHEHGGAFGQTRMSRLPGPTPRRSRQSC